MKIRVTVSALVLIALSIAVSKPAMAQNAIGGAVKTKPNTIGGLAKPAPVLGGASSPASVGAKPAAVGNVIKPNVVGVAPTPGSTGSAVTNGATGNAATSGTAAAMARPNPSSTAQNKAKTVGSTISNLKCGGGACVARGTKP
jgi:hypothetical protein